MEDKSMGISTATLNVTVFPRFGSIEESKQWIDNLTPEQRKKYYLSSRKTAQFEFEFNVGDDVIVTLDDGTEAFGSIEEYDAADGTYHVYMEDDTHDWFKPEHMKEASKKTAMTTDLEGLKKQLSKEEFEELFSGGNLTPWVDYKIGGFAIMFDPEKAVYHIGWYKDMSKKTAQPTIQDQLTGKLPANQTGQEKEVSEEEEPKEMEEGGMAGEGEVPGDELGKDEFFPE